MHASVITDLGAQTARTKDLSRGGICFILPIPLKMGIRFAVEISLVLGENTFSEALRLQGKVVWCTPVEEGYQIGASFVGLDGQTLEYLKMFLNFLANGVEAPAGEAGGDASRHEAEMSADLEQKRPEGGRESSVSQSDSGLFG
jgi:hypothetical protein